MSSNDEKDIRWKQRFQNFERSIGNLHGAASIKTPTEIERAGIIQFFEIAFELAWKTMKDYLQYYGYDVQYPRDTIKQAFNVGMVGNGNEWLEMLDKRNEMTHTYDEDTAQTALENIRVST